jgi:hypothetical protein
MMKTNQFIALIALLTLVSCGGQGTQPGTNTKNAAVCVWDNVSLKDAPEEGGKWVSAISIGETVQYLKETVKDEAAKKPVTYIKVKLKDKKEGWVQSDFVILDSRAATIIEQTPIYSRPDLLNKTDKFFGEMDIVAVKAESNGFLEVVGKRTEGKWIETGWIKDGSVTYTDVDIAVAKFAKKALSIKDDAAMRKALAEITSNPDFQESIFISRLMIGDGEDVNIYIEEAEEEESGAE